MAGPCSEVVFEAVQREVVLLRAKIRLIKEKLEEFERKYGMKTSEFIEKFNSGELGDEEDFFLWWSMHRALEKTEAKLHIFEKCVSEHDLCASQYGQPHI